MSRPESFTVGLDLGSTRIKAALLDGKGKLVAARSVAAPRLSGKGTVREGDVTAYERQAFGLLVQVAGALPVGTPLGIATQRSTFVVWDRTTGRPLTPMISWQDRRGEPWCAKHGDRAEEIAERTGLVLSAHYVGPKLAAMQDRDAALGKRLRGGRALVGTLESYLIWSWSGGQIHQTDPTVAARTLMMSLESGDWSNELLDLFEVPRSVLPEIVPTCGRDVELDLGLRVRASVGDQAAGALAVFDDSSPTTLINLGTGAFVLVPAGTATGRPAGYLAGPILSTGDAPDRFAWEGTVNGSGPAVDRHGRSQTPLPESDPTPSAFAIPDASGLGSPYWRADIGLTWSPGTAALESTARRRIVLEGLVFRLRQLIDDLEGSTQGRLLLSGGLSRDPFVAPALAALTDREIEQVDDHEGGLIGASRLAAGRATYGAPTTTVTRPGTAGAYLPEKYRRFRSWMDEVLAG